MRRESGGRGRRGSGPRARPRAAAEAGRFAEARDILRAALDAEASPQVAFNLSLMLRETGELVAATEVLQRLLANDYGVLPEERRARVAELLAEVTGQLATLRELTAPVAERWYADEEW